MNKYNKNFNFTPMSNLLFGLLEDHSSTTLSKLKNELNKFFTGAVCREVLYTNNPDKLFFGMRVYPDIAGDSVERILTDEKPISFEAYYVEIDSKLCDPMLGLEPGELTAILLHEVGHIVYDTSTLDEVKKNIDMYFANSGDTLSITSSNTYKELIAYALKDSVMKAGSLFTKFGNDEVIADSFVAACGFGPELETGFRKILRSANYMNKDVDDRFIVLSWTLRLYKEVKLKRLPAIRTLNKAKSLTASQLEKRELTNAVNNLNRLEDSFTEGALDSVISKFNKKFAAFKAKGVKSIKQDIYEFNLRLRAIETEDDALLLIRNINNDVSILEDYVSSEDISDAERQSIYEVLQELYSIRQKAAKESKIRSKYSSMINVIYPKL